MMMTVLIILIVAVGGIALAGVLRVLLKVKTTARLRQLFGPEYRRVLDRYGDRRKAEKGLPSREKRLEKLATRPLTAEAGGGLSIKKQIPNIDIVRSAWRRFKTDIKDAISRDLEPLKDVKAGGDVKNKSKSGARKSSSPS